MRGVNKVIIVGTLGNDPEVKNFPNGGSITTVSVATSEQWNDKQTGERKEATEWHRITFNNKLAEIAAQYLRKGSQVYIEGSLRTRKYQDQNGQDRYVTDIRADQMQMLGGRPAGQGMNDGGYGNGSGNNYQNNNNFGNNGGNGFNGGMNNGFNNANNGGYNNPNNGQNFNQNAGNNYPNSGNANQAPQGQGGYNGSNQSQPQNNPFMNANASTPPAHSTANVTTNATPTPKPGVVDDDVPFAYISHALANLS